MKKKHQMILVWGLRFPDFCFSICSRFYSFQATFCVTNYTNFTFSFHHVKPRTLNLDLRLVIG